MARGARGAGRGGERARGAAGARARGGARMSGGPARRYLRRHARAAAKPHRGGAPGGDAEGPWCPLDAEDFAMAAVLALARATEPALREELERRCPASGAVKYVRSKGSGRAFRALVRTGFGYLAPTVGAACAGLAGLGSGVSGRLVRLEATRVDLLLHSILSGIGGPLPASTGGKVRSAARHFGEVDVKKLYSLPIRAGVHVVDLLNAPSGGPSGFEFQDKRELAEACRVRGIPAVQPLRPEVIRKRSVHAVARRATLDAAVIVKPANEEESHGVRKVLDPRDPALEEAARGEGDWVVQDAVANCRALQPVLPPDAPLSCLRLSTFWCWDGARVGADPNLEVLEAWFRCGVSGATSDVVNSDVGEAGGRGFVVFSETGVVWRGSSVEPELTDPRREPSLTRANGASYDVTGFQLPFYAEAVALAKRAHRELTPHCFSVGWDIALTDQGPRILEANLIHNVGLFYGLRFGSLCHAWPRQALHWVSLARWLNGTPHWYRPTPRGLQRSLRRQIGKTERLLARARRREPELERRAAEAPIGPGDDLPEMLLLVCRGEQAGLERELAALRTYLREAAVAREPGAVSHPLPADSAPGDAVSCPASPRA